MQCDGNSAAACGIYGVACGENNLLWMEGIPRYVVINDTLKIALMFHTGYSPAVANFERGPILGKKGTHHHDEEKDLVGW